MLIFVRLFTKNLAMSFSYQTRIAALLLCLKISLSDKILTELTMVAIECAYIQTSETLPVIGFSQSTLNMIVFGFHRNRVIVDLWHSTCVQRRKTSVSWVLLLVLQLEVCVLASTGCVGSIGVVLDVGSAG